MENDIILNKTNLIIGHWLMNGVGVNMKFKSIWFGKSIDLVKINECQSNCDNFRGIWICNFWFHSDMFRMCIPGFDLKMCNRCIAWFLRMSPRQVHWTRCETRNQRSLRCVRNIYEEKKKTKKKKISIKTYVTIYLNM